MLQGKHIYIYNPWIKSTPLGYGLLSRYVINQSPQRIESNEQNIPDEEEEEQNESQK